MSAIQAIAELFYQSDVIAIRKGSLDIDFFRTFQKPATILQLADVAAQILDDYAIDALVVRPDSLAFGPHAAVRLELPMALWRNQELIGSLPEGTKRAIVMTVMTPTDEEIQAAQAVFQANGIELVGFFSFLGLPLDSKEPVRKLHLAGLNEILVEYQRLFLITPEEYQRLSTLQMGEQPAQIS